MFFKHFVSRGVTTLLVYVDNIVVTGDDLQGIEALKRSLLQEFEIKELGRLKYFLGIEVAHSWHEIFTSQQKYVLDLLTETRKLGCKLVATPIEHNH